MADTTSTGPMTIIGNEWQVDTKVNAVSAAVSVLQAEQVMNLAFFGMLSMGLPAVDYFDLGTF